MKKEKNHFYYPQMTAIFIYLYFYALGLHIENYTYGYFFK